jgi:predicted Zn finger-like uncharacterized protein
MRIVCPNCAAAYEVPASRMTPQRKVRCAGCGGEWVPMREASEAPPPPDAAPPPSAHTPDRAPQIEATLPPLTAMDRLSATAHRPRVTASLIAAWVMTFMALIAAVTAVVVWREPLVRIWPPGSRILGPISPPPPGPAKQ